jgi:hypothetical protein
MRKQQPHIGNESVYSTDGAYTPRPLHALMQWSLRYTSSQNGQFVT